MNILVSVIIPVYNGEIFIKRAIESLANQTCGNFEAIVVDDGSTDNTYEVCEKLSDEYAWLNCIHKENGGVSTARNAGLQLVKGSHIMFLDADDFFEPDAIKTVISVIDIYNPDIIDFGYNYVIGDDKYPDHHKLEKNTVLTSEVIQNRIIPRMINITKDDDAFVFYYMWNKVRKKELWDKFSIVFDESRRVWEDGGPLIDYLSHCSSYFSIDQSLYNYVSMPDSLSRKYHLEYFDLTIERYYRFLRKFGKLYDFTTPAIYEYYSNAIESSLERALMVEDISLKPQVQKSIEKTFNNEIVKEWFHNRENLSEENKEFQKLVIEGNVDRICEFKRNEIQLREKEKRLACRKQNIHRVVRKIYRTVFPRRKN